MDDKVYCVKGFKEKLKAPNVELTFVNDLDLLGLLYHTVADEIRYIIGRDNIISHSRS